MSVLIFQIWTNLNMLFFVLIWKIHFLSQCIPYLRWLLNNVFNFSNFFLMNFDIKTSFQIGACSRLSQTYKVKFFAKIANGFQPSIIFTISSIIFVSLGSEYAYGNYYEVSKTQTRILCIVLCHSHSGRQVILRTISALSYALNPCPCSCTPKQLCS